MSYSIDSSEPTIFEDEEASKQGRACASNINLKGKLTAISKSIPSIQKGSIIAEYQKKNMLEFRQAHG